MNGLSETEWMARRREHERRVEPWVAPRLARSSRHERHPVEDFLFEYYSHRPSALRRWHPGFGTALEGEAAAEYLTQRGYERGAEGITAAPPTGDRITSVRWICQLLENTAARPGAFGCCGMHEWAMVYRGEKRHASTPLRLSASELESFVESQPIRCSHYDAYRFFTPSAAPLNLLRPEHANRQDFEQPACLHANMDLYKWAYKLTPWIPSETVADAFALARDIRVVDMRASPYDLTSMGYEPIRIETQEGRAEYETRQREFSHRAAPLRERLISFCRALLQPAVLGAAAVVMLSACASKPVPIPEEALPVVGVMSRRLALAQDVARAKWATGLPVRDLEREREVAARFAARAEHYDIAPGKARRFMAAQIEASCREQQVWMRRWQNGELLPSGHPPSLDDVRRRLDALAPLLLAEWAATAGVDVPANSVRLRLQQDGFSRGAATAAASVFSGRGPSRAERAISGDDSE